ncbi:glutamate ABC transporter substrate-binding protein [Actinomadura atramentaria]|uniref:glutamate ABC transporter substrate-binding protein n=1 Tax=Actinomadura atramentaria TaxID=1990 RepID=UPI000360C9A9|nr:glutamate ABC transporter substrate-binding protein [Actinomadura atramentaria]
MLAWTGASTRALARRSGAACAALALLAAGGCAVAGADGDSVARKDELVIGMSPDKPGLGMRTGSTYSGFDVDVAREIAKRLGVPAGKVAFRPVTSATREKMLRAHDVDMVIASYSVTPERKTQVTFAGPYYVAHQDILVRRSDTSIKNVRDLKGKRLCDVPGSVSFPRVTRERGVAAVSVKADTYGECLTKLQSGALDAVSTDDLILAGMAAQSAKDGGAPLRIVNAPISDEPYGVGLARDDVDGCEAVNKAITTMYQDGTAAKLLKQWFGPVGLQVTTTVPQFEGCD